MSLSREFKDYHSDEPLPEYLTLAGVFSALFLVLWAVKGRDDRRSRAPVADAVLLALATHKLSRLATRDRVSAPLRAPFAEFEKLAGAGEVEETSRGSGMRLALGNLVTCPYCIAPWVAMGLGLGSHLAPRAMRLLTQIFSLVAVSDFLNQLYARLRDAK